MKFFKEKIQKMTQSNVKPFYESGFVKNNGLSIDYCSLKGKRKTMEDYLIVDDSNFIPKHNIFAIFDGHGSDECAKFMKDNFLRVFYNHDEIKKYRDVLLEVDPEYFDTVLFFYDNDIQKIFTEIFAELDNIYFQYISNDTSKSHENGTTANIILITPYKIICANLGDSRSILIRENSNIPCVLSIDHTIDYDFYRLRLVGANISSDNRLISKNGHLLNLSRSLGDFDYKKILNGANDDFVSVIPDVKIVSRSVDDIYIVMGCDGVWDVFSNIEMIHFINKNKSKGNIADILCVESLMRGSTDNITCIIIRIPN